MILKIKVFCLSYVVGIIADCVWRSLFSGSAEPSKHFRTTNNRCALTANVYFLANIRGLLLSF